MKKIYKTPEIRVFKSHFMNSYMDMITGSVVENVDVSGSTKVKEFEEFEDFEDILDQWY